MSHSCALPLFFLLAHSEHLEYPQIDAFTKIKLLTRFFTEMLEYLKILFSLKVVMTTVFANFFSAAIFLSCYVRGCT